MFIKSQLNVFHTTLIINIYLYINKSDPCKYSTFLRSRPDIMELEAIHTITQLCLQYQYVTKSVTEITSQPKT